MELRSLHYFVRIAELGSITRASAHLQIAQPALTRHVQRLEEELDTPLFTRANRGVRLTEAGHKLLESAQRILRDVERAGDEIRATVRCRSSSSANACPSDTSAACRGYRGSQKRPKESPTDRRTVRRRAGSRKLR